MRSLNIVDWIALILVIIGGLNWGVFGLFHLNVISFIFRLVHLPIVARIIYILVGLAAIYLLAILRYLAKK